jgi:hypothetical protein
MHSMAYFIEALMAAGDRRYDCVILSIRQAERRLGTLCQQEIRYIPAVQNGQFWRKLR